MYSDRVQSTLGWGPTQNGESKRNPPSSVREVEVGVVIVLSLADEGADGVEGEWQESDSTPDTHAVVHHISLDEELASTSVQEMEEPLLCSIRSVMPDVATS